MTHDELLAKIDDLAGFIAIGGSHWNIMVALRGIVELHKPLKYNYCSTCWTFDSDGDSRRSSWPCSTIKIINKELA